MMSGTVSLLFLSLCARVLAQAPTPNAQFNQVLNINGDMDLNSFTFPDRSRIEVFSQTQQQLIVNQNTPPVSPNQVTGSTGQSFVALMSQSMSINTNGATDLVGGQIELVMDPQMLQQNAVNPDNTFVAMLAPDRQSWMIMESLRSVNITDNTVRMVKRNSIDGEYMALGRQTVETNAVLIPFGTDQSSSAVIQGTGLQEVEFQDGFRMSVRATQPVSMTVDVKDGVEQGMLSALQGQQTVNDFRYSVVSNLAGVTPDLNRMVTVVQMPINVVRLQKMMQQMGIQSNGQVALAVAQRGVQQNPGGATGQLQSIAAPPAPQRRARSAFRKDIASRQVQAGDPQAAAPQAAASQAAVPQAAAPPAAASQAATPQAGTPQAGTPTNGNNPVATQLLLNPTFTPIQADAVIDPLNMRIAVPVRQVDGEFIITMQDAGAAVQPAAAAPEGEKPKPEGETAPANGTESVAPKPAERRQEEQKPPTGTVFMTMKEVDQMAELLQWGGQLPIGKMMTSYVKANNGTQN